MKTFRLIIIFGLVLLNSKPSSLSAQIPGAVFSTVCITEKQIIKKFGSKRNYDVWRSLHDRSLNLASEDKMKIIKGAKLIETMTPYALHQLTRYEARLYEADAENIKAAKLYDWLAESPAAANVEKKLAPEYAEKLRLSPQEKLQNYPPIQNLTFQFTQSARQKNKSGVCIVSFDVDPVGKTENIELEYCSSRYFKKSAKKTIKSSSFQPNPLRANETKSTRSQIRLDFYLMDKCGNILPH